VPHPTWFRYGGHLDNPEKTLYSFTHADQDQQLIFGIDTTTEEGRKEFKKEWDLMCQMVPELLNKNDLIYPHEIPKNISEEPHFRRVWQHYREHVFKQKFSFLVDSGEISAADAKGFTEFVDLANEPTFNLIIYTKLGKLKHLE
jgi:hypothetical protein